jgi:hypothetical protein
MAWTLCVSALLVIQLARASEWTVETNSFRVKEPSTLQGDYDAAIGDVSLPFPTLPPSPSLPSPPPSPRNTPSTFPCSHRHNSTLLLPERFSIDNWHEAFPKPVHRQ